jgi:sugar lactone lactonase YvrE
MMATLAIAAGAALFAGSAGAVDKVALEGKVFPESFGGTPDGTLYIGSAPGGVILKAAPGATTATPFIGKPADGPGAVLGVYADARSGLLWACYADFAAFAGAPAAASIVRAYDLASGAEKAAYSFPETSFCNDITAAADGTAYFADTMGSRVMRLKPGAEALDEWLVSPELGGIDGITLSPEGVLYANSVTTGSLFRIDIDAEGAGKVTKLTTSSELKGPDGMRFGSDGVLYLAENGAGQVVSVALDGDSATTTPLITGLDMPTAVDKAGDQLWVLEAKLGKMQDPDENGPFYVIPVN